MLFWLFSIDWGEQVDSGMQETAVISL